MKKLFRHPACLLLGLVPAALIYAADCSYPDNAAQFTGTCLNQSMTCTGPLCVDGGTKTCGPTTTKVNVSCSKQDGTTCTITGVFTVKVTGSCKA